MSSGEVTPSALAFALAIGLLLGAAGGLFSLSARHRDRDLPAAEAASVPADGAAETPAAPGRSDPTAGSR